MHEKTKRSHPHGKIVFFHPHAQIPDIKHVCLFSKTTMQWSRRSSKAGAPTKRHVSAKRIAVRSISCVTGSTLALRAVLQDGDPCGIFALTILTQQVRPLASNVM